MSGAGGSGSSIRLALDLVATTTGVGSIMSLISAFSSFSSILGNSTNTFDVLSTAMNNQLDAQNRLLVAQEAYDVAVAATNDKQVLLSEALNTQTFATQALTDAEEQLSAIDAVVDAELAGGHWSQREWDTLRADQAAIAYNYDLALTNKELADNAVADAEAAVAQQQQTLATKEANAAVALGNAQQKADLADLQVAKAQDQVAQAGVNQQLLYYVAALAGAAADAYLFDSALKTLITDASGLQYSTVQMDLSLHGTAQQISQLNPLIVQMADNSLYTTGQVTQLVQALSEHGLDVSQIMQGDAQAAIQMGEAMGIDAVSSGNLLASTLQEFSSQGLTAAQATNILTGAFYNGIPSASSLQSALDEVGGKAGTMGISLQDLSANLDILSQSGMDASSAGSSLNYVLQAIDNPTAAASAAFNTLGLTVVNTTSQAFVNLKNKLLDSGATAAATVTSFDGTSVGLDNMFKEAQKLGMIPLNETFNEWATSSGAMSSSLFDSKGNIKSLGDTIDQIIQAVKEKAGGNKELMADYLGQLFNVRSGRAMSILANLEDYKSRYNTTMSEIGKTSASKDAAQLLSTLQGSWQQLSTTFSSFLSTEGMPLIQWLSNFVGWLNKLVSSVMSASPQVKEFITIFIVAGAVLSTLAVIIGVVAVAVLFLDGALLPIILIVLAVAAGIVVIAAVIAGVILLVQNWGAVSKWLGEQWNHLRTTLGNFFSWLGTQAHQILTGVGNSFSQMGTSAHNHVQQMVLGVQQYFTNLRMYIQFRFREIVLDVEGAIKQVEGWFNWLYNHNYYFKDLVDFIRAEWQFFISFNAQIWHNITSFLSATWNAISTTAQHIWQGLSQAARSIWFGLIYAVMTVVTPITIWLHNLWAGIVADAKAMWFGLVYAVSTVVTPTVDAVKSLGQNIKQAFSAFITDAESWGKNLLKNFINGFNSMIGALKQSASNAASIIAKFLGFHSPAEEGPGKDADQWMPNLMRMLTVGITGSTGSLASAATNAAGSVRSGFLNGVTARGATGSGNQTITVQVGNQTLFNLVMNKLTGQFQINGMARNAR